MFRFLGHIRRCYDGLYGDHESPMPAVCSSFYLERKHRMEYIGGGASKKGRQTNRRSVVPGHTEKKDGQRPPPAWPRKDLDWRKKEKWK